ncbi:MAG: hypothetical protein AB7E04_05885 [Desulfobacteraceae bacterium]|jgi:uncharacterized protein YceK
MKINLLLLLFAVSVLACSGCASVTTAAWPRVEKEVVGKKVLIDEKAGYDYDLKINDKQFSVIGVPYCLEKASVHKISKKQHRGIVFIVIETPVWGLGLADWALSYMISENSIEEELVGYKPTGVKKECKKGNDVFPVQGKIMIQNPDSGEFFWTETNGKGEFSLEGVLGEYSGDHPWNIFLNYEGENRYLTTLWW